MIPDAAVGTMTVEESGGLSKQSSLKFKPDRMTQLFASFTEETTAKCSSHRIKRLKPTDNSFQPQWIRKRIVVNASWASALLFEKNRQSNDSTMT
jgi:hypothetical protein